MFFSVVTWDCPLFWRFFSGGAVTAVYLFLFFLLAFSFFPFPLAEVVGPEASSLPNTMSFLCYSAMLSFSSESQAPAKPPQAAPAGPRDSSRLPTAIRFGLGVLCGLFVFLGGVRFNNCNPIP